MPSVAVIDGQPCAKFYRRRPANMTHMGVVGRPPREDFDADRTFLDLVSLPFERLLDNVRQELDGPLARRKAWPCTSRSSCSQIASSLNSAAGSVATSVFNIAFPVPAIFAFVMVLAGRF